MQGGKPNEFGVEERKFWGQGRWVGKVAVWGGESEDHTEKIPFPQRFGGGEGASLRTSGESGFGYRKLQL